MDEPDGFWGHVPIFNKYFSSLKPEYRVWHNSQFSVALEAAQKFQEDLKVIPATGFHVTAYRGIWKTLGADDQLVSGIYMAEDELDWTYPKNPSVTNLTFAVHRGSLSALGTSPNPFHGLFERIVTDDLPRRWHSYLEWRRRQPRKPVPEWLRSLRAEEKKAKSRRNKANQQ